MNRNVGFKGNGKRRDPPYGRSFQTRFGDSYQRHRPRRRGFRLNWAWALVVVITGGIYAADRYQVVDHLAVAWNAPAADGLRASFDVCGESKRVTCVVDGDTFWLSGEKIRIADIDTPELSPPRCEAERTRGEAAKRRLRELLNAGPFSLVAGWRDEDQYGRKLRSVTRGGRSIAETMTAEGLARRWEGARRGWCD